jgi:two-component system, NarL family, response regulator NreC
MQPVGIHCSSVPRVRSLENQDDSGARSRESVGAPQLSVKVLLVNDRTILREALCALIERFSDVTVIAQAESLESARRVDTKPDIIITEVDLPPSTHAEVIEVLHASFPDSRILVLTHVNHPAVVHTALAAGADGYLLTKATSTDLLNGICALAVGESYLQPSLGVELALWDRSRESTFQLTPKEQRILRLIVLGHTNSEVARQVGMSVRTVETHRVRIHNKTGCRTRAELVEYAGVARLFDLDQQDFQH